MVREPTNQTVLAPKHDATALPPAVQAELNRMVSLIHETITVLDGVDLRTAAVYVLDLARIRTARPLGEQGEDDLRALLGQCVQALAARDPEMLMVVHCFVDALGRARAQRVPQLRGG